MAERKMWLMKFKSRISKLKLHEQKKKKLPDLITPTHEKINEKKVQIQREGAIRVNPKDIELNNLNIKDRPEKDVPDGRTRIATGQRKEKNYKRENEKSWRMTMNRLLRNKVFTTIVMMLIVLVGMQGEVSAKNMMSREKSDYIIGSYRRNTSTAIAASRVTSITFTNVAPSGAVDSWDVSATQNAGDVTAYIVPSTTATDGTQNYALYLVSSDSHFAVSSGAHLFSNYTNVTSITNLNYLDLSASTSAYAMFYNMKNIGSLNLSSISFSNVTTMGYMFSSCENLRSLTLSSSNAPKLTNMEYFMYGCKNLSSVNLSNFGATKVTNMNRAFYNCAALTTLNLSGFSTAEITNLTYAFYGCKALTSLNLSGLNTKQVTTMESLFYNCAALTTLNLSGFNTENVTTMEEMFYNCQKLTSLNLSSFNTSKVENFNQFLMYCYALESITFGNNFTTSNATALRDMFAACNALKSIDTSKIDTSKAETLEGMFKGCKALTEIDVSHFNTSSAKCMASMFDSCISLTILDLSSFDTSGLDGVTGWYSWSGGNGKLVDTHAFLYASTNLEVLILGPKFTRLDGKNFFNNTGNLKKIISLKNPSSATDILSISDDNLLQNRTNVVLYVPNATAEGYYEANATYVEQLTTSRIKPLLSINGSNPTRIIRGATYIDAGANVADYSSAANYNPYGLTLTTAGATIDTSVLGSKTVTYTLKYTAPNGSVSTFETKTRTVNVEAPTKNLMSRDNTSYPIGAYRAGITQYTPDSISKIKFTNVTPSSCVAFWDVSEYNGDAQVMSYLVQSGSKYEQHIVASSEVIAPANSAYLFKNYTSVTTIEGLDYFNATNLTSTRSMFYEMNSLTNLNLSRFNMTNVTDSGWMFYGCKALTGLNLGGDFRTGKVTLMASMFAYCESLEILNLGNYFDTSKVTNMQYMFYNCDSLKTLTLGNNFNTSNVTDMSSMFDGCKVLTSINTQNFNTSKVTDFEAMFSNCLALTDLDVSNFDTSSAKNMALMFDGCESLTFLDLSMFDTSALDGTEGSYMWSDNAKCINLEGMFNGCAKLETLILGEKFSRLDCRYMFSGATSLKRIISKNTISNGQLIPLSTDTYLGDYANAIFYVLTPTIEASYEANATYMSELGADRIQPMITMLGKSPLSIALSAEYIDPGVTIAGYGMNEMTLLNNAGITLTTNLPIDTSTIGTKSVEYTLNWKTSSGSTVTYTKTRTVNVKELPTLMPKDFVDTDGYVASECYVLGAKRAGKTGYKAECIENVIFTDIAPSSYKVKWDLSYTDGDNDIISYLVASSMSGDVQLYDQYIVADTDIYAPKDSMGLFIGYTNTKSIKNIEKLNTSKAETMRSMFGHCTSLTTLDLSTFDTTKVESMHAMFYQCLSLESLNVSSFNTAKVTNMRSMFNACTALNTLNIDNFDTSKVTNMRYMFYKCGELTQLDVSGFNTANVTDMYYMFNGCEKLPEIDVSNFDTSKVTTMEAMFKSCKNVTKLDVSGFNTNFVTEMSNMFCGCEKLTELILTSFDTSQVTTMENMFNGCKSLTSLAVNNFDTSNVTIMTGMFESCENLTQLDVSGLTTAKVTHMDNMFRGCSSLTELSLQGITTASVSENSNMFENCNSLRYLILGPNFNKLNGVSMFQGTDMLEKIISLRTSVMSISSDNSLNQLPTCILYVPNQSTEALYEANSTYMSLLGANRIQPIMSIAGSNPMIVEGGSIYGEAEDPGINVLNWAESDATNYNNFGFTTETSGLAVNTNTQEDKKVTYKLYYTDNNGVKSLLDTQERTVKIANGNYLVGLSYYKTLESAIAAINGIGTIQVARDCTDSSIANIPSGKTITLNLGNYTITKTTNNIVNNGTLTIEGNGVLATSTLTTLIENKSNLYVKSGTINNYPNNVAITSSTANLVIGDSTNDIEITPIIRGGKEAITATAGFDFYDGILKGITQAYTGTVNNMPTECEVSLGSEVIDGTTFKTAALSTYLMLRNYDVDSNGVPYATYAIGAEEAGKTAYTSESIESITFENYITTDSSLTKWDVSNSGNGGIKAWVTDTNSNGKYELHIGSAGKIRILPKGLEMLFASYKNCTVINNLEDLSYDDITSLYGTFCGAEALTTVDISDWTTDKVANMAFMFKGCKNINEIDLTSLNTSKVTNLESMFDGCSSVTTLAIDGFDTSLATNMKAMFRDCENITDLSVEALELGNVTTIESMFENCSSLVQLDFENLNTSNVLNMSKLFYGCLSLTNSGIQNIDVSKVKNVSGMFANCASLTSMDLHTWNLSNLDNSYTSSKNGINYAGKNMMFENCVRLETLLINKNFNGLNGTNMFVECVSLKSIIANDAVTQAGEIIQITSDTGVDQINNPTFYVPDTTSESVYEANSNYVAMFGTTRIRPLLGLIGDNRIELSLGADYQELGYVIAGEAEDELSVSGYNVTISGADKIDTSKMEVYEVTYTLKYTDPQVANATTKTLMTLVREIQIGNIQLGLYIDGKNEYDSVLTAETFSSSVPEENLTYQWFWSETNDTSNGTLINGANSKSYTVKEGLVGKYIYVKVTASLENYDDVHFYDITDDGMNYSAIVAKKILVTPVFGESFVYNGKMQTYIDAQYIEKYMEVTGNTGINAGDYTATFSLKQPDDCAWSTTSDKNVEVVWTISPKAIAVVWDGPFEFTYNQTEQGPELHCVTAVDGETAILTRTMEVDAGNYLSVATLSDISGNQGNVANYTLLNDSVSFEIIKATPTFNVAPRNLVLTDGNAGVLTYEMNIESFVTATSLNEDVASVGSINSTDKTIEVISNGVGSTTVNVTLNETNNYNAVTIPVTVGTMDAKYTDGTNYYETLFDAFSGVENGGSIIVLKDVAENTVALLESGKSVTLKINAHTLTANVNDFVTVKGQLSIDGEGTITAGSNVTNLVNIDAGTLNINTGVVLNGYNCAVSNNYGEFNMNGGKLAQNNSSSTSAVLYVNQNSVANINGGTITSVNEGAAIENAGTVNVSYNVSSVTIENSSGTNKVISNNGTFNIVAATVKGQIYNTSTNGMTIENSTLSVGSGYALNSSAGEITLKNTVVTGTRLLNLEAANATAKLIAVTSNTTDSLAILMSEGVLDILEASNITSVKSVLETYGTVNIVNSTLETTSSLETSANVINAKTGSLINVDGSSLIANVGRAITNDATVNIINNSNVSSLGENTVLNAGNIKVENSALKNENTGVGVALDNDGTAELTNSAISSNGKAVDNSLNITVDASTITSVSNVAFKTSGVATMDNGTQLNGATGIENTGTLTFGTKDGTVLRDNVKVNATSTAVNNGGVFNWNDGEITGNAATIYVGNDPIVEDNVAIASEINGSLETRYVVKDMEKPVIENLISETDWTKNSQTIQVIATDNVKITGYAITETNVEPAVDSNVWVTGNTFIVTENKTYYIWVKDDANNVVGKEFIAKWICLEIWDTTGTSGSETRGILHVDGRLVFEVKSRAQGITPDATGTIKDYTISNAEWSDDLRITSIVVSEGITGIGNYGLSNLPKANSVSLPASLTTMSSSAMYRTNNYSSLSVSDGNSKFIDDGLAVYDTEKTVLYSYSSSNADVTFVMPETVREIATGLFYDNKNVDEIRTSKNIVIVGEDAFEFVTGDVYYYTSTYEMKTYAINNDTEANFIPIDDVKPEITSFVINNNDAAATALNVTLSVEASDDVSVKYLFASETYHTDTQLSQMSSSNWIAYSGTNYPFALSSNAGTKKVYVWVKDANDNISDFVEDDIYYGNIAFDLHGQKEIVQYVDTTGKDYYRYIEEIQGGTTSVENITIDVVGSVNHRVVGTYVINYGITIDGTLMQSKTRTIDVIENSWNGATGTTDGGYEYIIHANGKYAKITKYTGTVSSTLTIPESVTHNGVTCKVIDVGPTSDNVNMLGTSENTVVTTVVLPETLINIDKNAFAGFSSLQNVNIPDAVMSISDSAFKNSGTNSGMNISFSDNFREVKTNAFMNAKVTSLDLGNGIRHIGESAFANVDVPSRFVLNIPANLDAIDAGAFESTRIYDIKVDESNVKFELDTSDMALLTDDGETLVLYPIDSDFEEYVFDEGVKVIASKAFKDANKLKSVTFSSTVTEIESYAFMNTTNLSEVVASNVASTIGEYAFANSGIEAFELNSGIVDIEKGTFENSKLEFIRIPKNVLRIKSDAFKGNTKLKTAVIESKPNMESNIFNNCTSLEFIMLTNTNGIATIADTTAIPADTILYVPSSMEAIYEGDSIYKTYQNYTNKIQPILELIGEQEIVWLVNTPYVESGVELVGEILTTASVSSKIDGLQLVIEGNVDTTKSERFVIKYIAKYNGVEVNRVERIVDIEDTEAPVIANVSTDSDWVVPNQTFVVDATDNIGVTNYIITESSGIPALDDSKWQTSNNLKVGTNGTWYIYVKDAAGNISERKQVVSSWVAANKWDVSKSQNNTVHAVVTLDGKELIIKGVGETKDYTQTSWSTDFGGSIQTVRVETGVASIGDHLLANLPQVTTINIANSVVEIANGAFAHTNEFNSLELNGNSYLVYENGTLYNKDKTKLYVHTNAYTTDYSLPTAVKTICEAAFANSIYVSNLDLTNIIEIQDEAFKECTHLTNQYIPKTIESIGADVFDGTQGPIYYYSSSEVMKNYVSEFGSETNFVEIDDILPVINKFTINNNQQITKDTNVTLQIEIEDNKGVEKILIANSMSDVLSPSDSRWIAYNGEAEIPYVLDSNNGVKTLYMWALDGNNNISNAASDSIVLGENDFSFEYNDDIVQYVDTTEGNYYKFDQEVQGKYFVSTEGFSVKVNSNVDVTTVGEKQISYTLSFNGTPAGEFYKNIDVIEDSWGTQIYTDNGFNYVKHSTKNYAKIVKYTLSNTVVFPSTVSDNGVSYKVIEIESLDNNPVISISAVSVTLPNTIISIGKNAFVGCSNLTTVDLKENVMTIEENAFKDTGLRILDLKLNVREVKEGAFENTKINTLTHSKLLKSIETKAFGNALNIPELVIPGTIVNVAEGAYAGSIIDSIRVSGDATNSGLEVHNRALINTKTYTLLQYATGSADARYELDLNNVQKIGVGAFKNATNLSEIVLKDVVKEIGAEAFRNTSIGTFELPLAVTSVPEFAFADNEKLEILVLNGVTSLKVSAFENDIALNSLVILTNANTVCEIDDASKLDSITDVYVLDDESYINSSNWSAISDRIHDVFRLNGEENVTVEAGFEYVDSGVYAIDTLFTASGKLVRLEGLSVEIEGSVNTDVLGMHELTYELKSNNSMKASLTRIVNVTDTIAPRIDAINTIDEAQALKERFTVVASDNHKIAGYAITKEYAQPLLNSSLWNTSNVVYADQNGTWYVWVKDEAGNVSSEVVEATHICTEKWDIGVIANTVYAVVTTDNTLLIEGIGAVKYFTPENIPWINYSEAIRKIEVTEGVTTLEKYTLSNMKNVAEISLPSTLTSVATSTFIKTNNFTTLIFPNGTDSFVYEDYTLYSADKSLLYVHSNKDTRTSYIIDENVEIIAEYAFNNNANIIDITTTSNPTLLVGAFSDAYTLQKVIGNIGGTEIGAYAFENCSKLQEISISEEIVKIGSYAFSNCNMITEIEMIKCSNLTTLEHHAFANLNNLSELKVYRTITQITADARGIRNVFENMGSNFVENAKVYYFEGCTSMEQYAKLYADEKVDFILIDQLGPRVEKLIVENQEDGTYAAGTTLEIVAKMTEEFVTYKGTIPTLAIRFGNGPIIDLGVGEVGEAELRYSYVIQIADIGELKCASFTGELYDNIDNRTIFNSQETFEDSTFARTGVMLESDFEDTKYFTYLNKAAEYITLNGKLTMLLDENSTETSIFKPNTLVSLDINGKRVVFNSDNTNSLIINRGVLNITDSGAGALSVVGTASGEVTAITNEGILTVVKGIVRAQGSGDVTAYGVDNKENATLTINGGSVEGVNNKGLSYGVVNRGELIVEGGTIQSSTVEGKTYGLYNIGNANIINGEVAARLSTGTKGDTVAIYIDSGSVIVGNGDENITPETPIIYSTKDGLINDGGNLEFYDGFIEGQAYRSLSTPDVKVIPGYALIRKLVGTREKAMLDFDVVKPTINLTNLTPNWTNNSVTIEAHFIDEESGIKTAQHKGETLELVNGKITVEVHENTTLTFTASDFAGNVTEKSIEITNIDRVAPSFENLKYEALANDEEVTLTVTIKDDAAGVYGYSLSKFDEEPKNWTKVNTIALEKNVNITVKSNGKYYLYAIDDAGNVGRYSTVIDITNVDAYSPTIESLVIEDEGRGFANSSVVIIKVDAEDDTGVEEILLSNSLLTNSQVLDSENWVPYTEEVIWELPIGDGEKTVYVWVKDRVGRISRPANVTTKLLAQYIGNNGTNSTTYKLLSKDSNYNFDKQIAQGNLRIKVKDTTGVETYTGAYGSGITLEPAPIVYGPAQEGSVVMNGRYYFLVTNNLEGNGIIYICLSDSVEVDKAGNKIQSDKLEIATDVTIELEAPYITIGSTQLSVYDTDAHVINAIRVDGRTIKLKNGVITKEELESTYGVTLTSGTVIEAFDKCGNVRKQVIS